MREDQYRQLLSIGRSLVETFDPERVLERLLEVARDITGARYAAIGVLDEDRARLSRFLTSGIDAAARARIGELPRGRGVLGELIRRPEPLRLDAVGEHTSSFGFPPGHPQMTSFLGVPVVIGGEPFGNLYLTEKAGAQPFDTDDEEAAVIIAEWAAVAIQNARLHEDVSTRRDELERSVATLETTTSIAKALAGETDLDRVLELIAKRGRAVVDARLLFITLVTPDGVIVAAAAGDGARAVRGRTIAADESATAKVLASRSPLRVTHRDGVPVVGQGAEIARQGADTALVVPLVFRGRGIGALAAIDCTTAPTFTEDHERLLEAFADSAATAVGTAQTVISDQRRRAVRATEAERRRWARELHDDTLQELAAVRLALSLGQRADSVDDLRAAMRRAMGDLDERIHALRALISDLRPPSLDVLGVQPALEGLVRRMESRGPDIRLAIDLAHERGDAPERLTSETEDGIYRLVQEALTNTLKHAGAKRVDVRISERGGRIALEIVDDGCGFDPTAATEGFGLLGMRERAELLGGGLEIAGGEGEGTAVRVWLPARRADASASRAVS